MQFLGYFNRYLGGSRRISKDVMTEFFHNLSMQVFSVSNDEVILKFNTISALVKNIACFAA